MTHLLARSDARRIPLPDGSVQCCVTSPPYFGLRDYGVDGQLGLEDTPDAYVAGMVAAFREVRRVLRPDGVAFLNIGDSYSSGSRTSQCDPSDNTGKPKSSDGGARRPPPIPGIKEKDLLGIPWALAFALRDDGWWLRDAIVWSKADVDEDDDLEGSAMPSSQKDRCTFAYEHVFQLAKSPRYFFDGEAIKTSSGAMMRNVWRINTESFPGSHFAVMPRKLAETCIKAGTSERGYCPSCGRAWERVVEYKGAPRNGTFNPERERATHAGDGKNAGRLNGPQLARWREENPPRDLGFRQACPCPAREPVPCLVLDPFSGVSTTGVAALALGRRYIGFDLSAEYLAMARRRIERPHVHVRKKEKALPLFAGMEEPA